MYVYTRVCVCMYNMCDVCMVVCYSISDSYERSELGNRRFRVGLVMDPIYWQLEDQSMRLFVGSYQFVQ